MLFALCESYIKVNYRKCNKVNWHILVITALVSTVIGKKRKNKMIRKNHCVIYANFTMTIIVAK